MSYKQSGSKVAVALSGGVDSAVAAAILKEQGYEVVGVHLHQSDLGLPGCTAQSDMADAQAVANFLGIPFKIYDFRDEYQRRVIDRFVEEYQNGRTPNPDIWCNEAIKFGLFLDKALTDLGVDYVATGHYARVEEKTFESDVSKPGKYYVLKPGVDPGKDQSYFLYRLNQEQLSRVIFPLGGMFKRKVRAIARELGLPVADKRDSVGVCFIGEIDLKEFLKERINFQPGEVVNTRGEVIGRHDGVQFYTIGQRHGFEITRYQGDPVYVIDKDVSRNRLIVGRDRESDVSSFMVADLHFINPFSPNLDFSEVSVGVRIRHLGKIMSCSVNSSEDSGSNLLLTKEGVCELKTPARGVAPGQHAVFYSVPRGLTLTGEVDSLKEECGDLPGTESLEVLGGGVIQSFTPSYK